MKSVTQALKDLILRAAVAAHGNGVLPSREFPPVEIDEPKLESHGDFSTNIALISASIQKLAPRKIAEAIVSHIEPPVGLIQKTEIAGPGFINFFIAPEAWRPVLEEIHRKGADYGASDIGRNRKIQVEFVSANPTGPLHVGHGRGAAVGDTVAAILAFIGYDVQREYYINDSGRQIQTLGRSVHLRCRELLGDAISFPEDCYRGDYIIGIAKDLLTEKGRDFMAGAPEQAVSVCARYAAGAILSGIRKDLDDFGVNFDRWYSEQTLYDSGTVDRTLARLEKDGLVYEKEGARWFVSSRFGDEKDRVVVRNNGQTTYFASDIAYHQEKYDRGFDRIIDVWGADHHGYIPRMAAAVMASGRKREQFHVILIQLVNLLRGGEPVAMSSRAGEFVTLREVMDEVGRDAARFIFLTRHYDSKLDFDLELAKKKSNDNPVYYVQYVHARISSILEKAREAEVSDFGSRGSLSALKEPEEVDLMKHLTRFPEIVETAGVLLEPHRITYFLLDLAQAFHVYYNKHRVLTESPEISAGRLYLVRAIRTVIRNGLRLLGVSTPEKM